MASLGSVLHRSLSAALRRRHAEPAPAQEATPTGPSEVWVLPGGGGLGAAQVGMARELLAAGSTPDLLIGCSVGALNATYLSTGCDTVHLDLLEAGWRSLTDADVFPGRWWDRAANLVRRRPYLVEPAGLRRVIESFPGVLALGDLSRTKVPVEIVTTVLDTGETVFHSSGPVVDTLMASAAIPGVFPPQRLADGRLHIDGGVTCLSPVARALSHDPVRVWVLDIVAPAVAQRVPRTSLDVLLAGFALSMRAQAASSAEALADPRVHLISLGAEDAGPSSPFSLGNTAALIDAGAAAARRALDEAPVPV